MNWHVSFSKLISPIQSVQYLIMYECWLYEGNAVAGLHLKGYSMFFQRGNRVGHGHCGLVTNIHESFLCKESIIENSNTSWDYLCVELSHNSPNSKKYLLCNVYRLPCHLTAEIDC